MTSLHLPPRLGLVWGSTLAAGLLSFVLTWRVFARMTDQLGPTTNEKGGLVVAVVTTVLVVPLWRWLAARPGGFSVGGGCLAVAMAWIGSAASAWLVVVTVAVTRPPLMLRDASVSERVLEAAHLGKMPSMLVGIATLPAAFALILLVFLCGWCRRRQSETRV